MHKLLLLLFVLGASLSAQDLSLSGLTVPPGLRKDASSVIRSYEQHYRATSPGSATLRVRKVVTLLNDNHYDENELVVHYDDDSKITRFKATLYDALGQKVRSAKKSEIEDVRATSAGTFYGDSRVQTTTITHTSYPYTVEFEYEKKLSSASIFQFPRWLPMVYDQSVESSVFTAEVSTDNKLLYHANDLPEPTVTEENGMRTYRWEVKDLPARKWEPAAPPASRNLPYVRTALHNFDLGDYAGSMASWDDFGQFMNRLIAGRDELPVNLKTLVHETTDDLGSDREKIAALYRLLQDRTRYVGVQLGIGGYQPFPAKYVEENRYGDCKALSNYLGAMLKEVDIASYPVLIDWNDRSFFPVDEEFTTSAFNHMILYVPEEDMYLECTSSVSPPGYLGSGKEDRNVLWVTPEGGKLVRTPAAAPADNGYVRTIKVAIQADGGAEIDLHTGYYGATQERYRRFAHAEPDASKQLEYFNKSGTLPDVHGSDYSLTFDPDEPVADLTYRTSVPGYARKLGKRFFVPLNKYYRYESVPDPVSERRLPVESNVARFYVDTVHLSLPQDMEIESMGDAEITFAHATGEYWASVTSPEDGRLTWIRTLKLLPVSLPAEAYADYRQFFVDVAKADRRQIVLRQKRTK
ncbi:MAG: DUF3857 domain-containing protein [Bacteroidota bacterium]